MGVTYYAIYDPLQQLGQKPLYTYALREGQYLELDRNWLPQVSLGLTLWQGTFEEIQGEWLRWCDEAGSVIATGAERADQEHERAEQERQRAEAAERRVAELLQQMQTMNIQPVDSLDESSEG